MRKNGFHAALAAAFMTMLVLPGIAGAENQPVPTAEQAAAQQYPALAAILAKADAEAAEKAAAEAQGSSQAQEKAAAPAVKKAEPAPAVKAPAKAPAYGQAAKLEKIEMKIAELEATIKMYEVQMNMPQNQTDADAMMELTKEYEAAQAQLDEAYEKWEALSES